MSRRFRSWPIARKQTFWLCSVLLSLAIAARGGEWKEVDRVALIVGNRPVTLSEVRAYHWLHTGRDLPEVLDEETEALIIRMTRMERLYESRRRYGGSGLAERWVRLAIQFLANAGFPGLDPAASGRPVVSPALVRAALRRELTVMRFVQARVATVSGDESALSDLVEREAPDIRLINYLF